MSEKTVIIIGGPTASGKTSLAIDVARHFNTAIISADSRQCFRELNIGVAKPTKTQLSSVKHYFINTHSIHDEVNAVTFESYALEAAQDIFQHNDVAVMAGGTGLYIKAFCEGMDAMPPVSSILRLQLMRLYEEKGLEWLQAEVKIKDPDFWNVAEQQNPQRLLRALEIVESTGDSFIKLRKGVKQKRKFSIIKVAIDLTREQLYSNINQRVNEMIHEGLLYEVESLLPYQQLNALQTVGYKELFDYLNQLKPFAIALEEIKMNTRRYAKRQITWFKKDLEFKWLPPTNSLQEIIVGLVKA